MCNEAERVCSRGCNVNRADLNIILDSSSSVRDANFNLMRNFVLDLITNFQIGPGAVHLSILRYNNRVDVRHYFNQSQDLKDVYDAVRNIPYRGSGTKTGQAIQFTLDNLFKTGAGMRPSVPQICLVMTDGKSADDVIVPSEALRASGVSVYAVGIGRVDEETIQNIAGAPNRAFMARTFEELSGTLLDDIRHSLCTSESPDPPLTTVTGIHLKLDLFNAQTRTSAPPTTAAARTVASTPTVPTAASVPRTTSSARTSTPACRSPTTPTRRRPSTSAPTTTAAARTCVPTRSRASSAPARPR